MIARRLPESARDEQNAPDPQATLLDKGLPAVAISKTKAFLKLRGGQVWNFMLEAKDLKHASVAGYRIKKMFANYAGAESQSSAPIMPALAEKEQTEEELLEAIKQDPHNWPSYDALGKHYMGQEKYEDCKDIYLYLAKHEPTNSDYFAKLGFCWYKLKNFPVASEMYEKSLALDSTQPTRYYNWGLSLDAQGKLPEAVEAFRRALALEVNNKKFYTALSKTYTKMGQKTKAKEALQKAAQIVNS